MWAGQPPVQPPWPQAVQQPVGSVQQSPALSASTPQSWSSQQAWPLETPPQTPTLPAAGKGPAAAAGMNKETLMRRIAELEQKSTILKDRMVMNSQMLQQHVETVSESLTRENASLSVHYHETQKQLEHANTILLHFSGQSPPLPALQALPIGQQMPPGQVVEGSALFRHPTRSSRPARICIILRGLPGSGKSRLAKLMKRLEIEAGSVAPRIVCADDYHIAEVEEAWTNPSTNQLEARRVVRYTYDPSMSQAYKLTALNAVKSIVEGGQFPLVVVDGIHSRMEEVLSLWSLCREHSMETYVCDVVSSPELCAARNIHGWNMEDVSSILNGWEWTPNYMNRLDVTSLLSCKELEDIDSFDEGLSSEAPNVLPSRSRRVLSADMAPQEERSTVRLRRIASADMMNDDDDVSGYEIPNWHRRRSFGADTKMSDVARRVTWTSGDTSRDDGTTPKFVGTHLSVGCVSQGKRKRHGAEELIEDDEEVNTGNLTPSKKYRHDGVDFARKAKEEQTADATQIRNLLKYGPPSDDT